MNTTVAMRASFDPTFPDLKLILRNQDRVPGRELAELVVRGLREKGFKTSEIEYQEPFFVTRCRAGEFEYPILSYIADSDADGPAWAVSCRPTIGFFGRLFGRSEAKEMSLVLNTIHHVLKSDGRIGELRWFKEPPVGPFSQTEYSISP